MKTLRFTMMATAAILLPLLTGCRKTTYEYNCDCDKEGGYSYVDLGLSVNWAQVNVGAAELSDYGSYFAWGETESKSCYSIETYKWADENGRITKYCSNPSYDDPDNLTELEAEDDAAAVLWGNGWRTPTDREFAELLDKCTWTWSTVSGVRGYKVTSNVPGYEGKYIFLPASGMGIESTIYPGYEGYYWSSTNSGGTESYRSISLQFKRTDFYSEPMARQSGATIRPVHPKSGPQPWTSPLEEYINEFKLYDMLYKVDPSSGITYIETWKAQNISGQESYIPFIQCILPDGSKKFNSWVAMTTLPAEQYINKTVFDITASGDIIDIFNVKDVTTGAQIPYIQKFTTGGRFPWGRDGKEFYRFKQDLSEPVSPCEGYVASDGNGGAWIAAGNGLDSIVVSRVNSDGERISEWVKFSTADGTLGEKTYVSNPQMLVGSDGSLFLLLQYASFEYAAVYSGYYDLVKISPDGRTILRRSTLMNEKNFTQGIHAQICEDGRGGAYVLFNASVEGRLHAFLEHFDKDGKVDFPEADLTPSGSGGSLKARLAVDPASGKCVTVMTQSDSDRAYMMGQVVDLSGSKLVGEDGFPLLLLTTDDGDDIAGSYGFRLIHNPASGKINLYYVLNRLHKDPVLKACTISTGAELSEMRDVVEIDASQSSDGDAESRDAIFNGKFRHYWMRMSQTRIYGITDTLE